jgi:hypothetical protein
MSKYIVLYGKNSTPGTAGTKYEIFDTVNFDPKKDLHNQMRKYSFRKFYENGKRADRLRSEIFCRRRNIILHDGKIFAEKIKIFDDEITNKWYGFVPAECFEI